MKENGMFPWSIPKMDLASLHDLFLLLYKKKRVCVVVQIFLWFKNFKPVLSFVSGYGNDSETKENQN